MATLLVLKSPGSVDDESSPTVLLRGADMLDGDDDGNNDGDVDSDNDGNDDCNDEGDDDGNNDGDDDGKVGLTTLKLLFAIA